jgi:hypothetical protein
MVLFALLATAWAAPPLEIRVGPEATHVILECAGGKRLESKVVAGKASFSEVPSGCVAHEIVKLGAIDGAGVWACSPNGCEIADSHHREVKDAAGRINVVMSGAYDTQWLEVTCGNTYRERANFTENAATFEAVPAKEACELHFKGGTPARYRPITPGSWRCTISNTTAVCTQYTPA